MGVFNYLLRKNGKSLGQNYTKNGIVLTQTFLIIYLYQTFLYPRHLRFSPQFPAPVLM